MKFLPLNVKAVLETKSPKYQSIISFAGTTTTRPIKEEKKEEAIKIDFIENQLNKPRMTKPVIVPSAVNAKKVTKLSRPEHPNVQAKVQSEEKINKEEQITLQDLLDDELETTNIVKEDIIEEKKEIEPIEFETQTQKIEELEEAKPKRGRGRPRKIVQEDENKVSTPKRGRGRPRKVVQEEPINQEPIDENSVNLFDLQDEENDETILPGFEKIEEEPIKEEIDNLLPGLEDEEDIDNIEPVSDVKEQEPISYDDKNEFYGATKLNNENNNYNNNYNVR